MDTISSHIPFVIYDQAARRYTACCPCGKLEGERNFRRQDEAYTVAWVHVIRTPNHQWEEPQ